MKINCSFYPFSTACMFIFCANSCHPPENHKSGELPNIVLIVADDLGYNDLGVYGSKDIKTPNLDKLARQGARFTNFYSACSVCTPSRGSLLTGRYPQRNGTYELFRNDRADDNHLYGAYEYSVSPERILGMDLQEVFIQELLKKAGYVNGIFGKWDLGQLRRFLPLQRGFDQFYGFVNTGIDYYTHERYGVPSMYRDNEPTTEDKGTYCTDLFEREALRFLNEYHQHPFFLFLPHFAPHSTSNLDPRIRNSIQAPPEYLALYPEGTTPREIKRREYMAAVTCMDAAIGNVLNLIDSFGLEGNTVVIFMSDNGGGTGSDNSPLSGGKARMWEGGLRVPCIVKWPGQIKEGLVIDNFLSSLEIFPTLLSATGIQKPDSLILDGFDILPLLKGEENMEREEMFWELRGEYAARIGDLKWIESGRGSGLFNLTDDLAEKNDLSETNPADLAMVKDRFNDWQTRMQDAEPRGPFRNF
jgi:arylsulfatase A-like enzyme